MLLNSLESVSIEENEYVPIVSISNNYDLPLPSRGKAIPVLLISTAPLDSIQYVSSKLSVSVKSFTPCVTSAILSADSEKSASLSFYDHHFSDLQDKFYYPFFEDHIPPLQKGSDFSFSKSIHA